MKKQKVIQLIKILLAILLIGYVLTMVVNFQDSITDTLASSDAEASYDVTFHSIQDPVEFEWTESETDRPSGLESHEEDGRVVMPAAEFHERFHYALGALSVFRFADKSALPWILALSMLGYTFAVTRWYILLRTLKIDVPYREVYMISWMGMFFNNILISIVGGDLIRAIYITRKTKEKTAAVTSLMIDRVLGLISLAILAGVAIVPNLKEPMYFEAAWLVAALIAVAIMLASIFFVDAVRNIVFHNRWLKRLPVYPIISKVATAGHAFKNEKAVLLGCIILSVLGNLTFIFVVMSYGHALGDTEVVLSEYLVIVPVCQLIAAVPIVPAGWGIAEISYAFFFAKMGAVASFGAVVSLVLKLNNILLSLPGAVMWGMASQSYSAQAMKDLEADISAAESAESEES